MHNCPQSIRVEKSGVYPFDHSPVWSVRKADIRASATSLAAAEIQTFPTKYSALLIDLNANSVDALTTSLATELSHKCISSEATSAGQADRVTVSDSEIEKEEEDNNHAGTALL